MHAFFVEVNSLVPLLCPCFLFLLGCSALHAAAWYLAYAEGLRAGREWALDQCMHALLLCLKVRYKHLQNMWCGQLIK
jgi:hypothetical protein